MQSPTDCSLSDDAKRQSGTEKTPQGKTTVHHLKFELKKHTVLKQCPTKMRITAIQSAENEGNKSRRVRNSRTVSASVYYHQVFWVF